MESKVTEGFSLMVRNDSERTEVVCIGVLDLLPAEKVREAVRAALDRAVGTVVLDCSGVTLLTSAGITALVDSAVEAREAEQTLRFRFGPDVRRILDLVGLWWLGVIDDGVAVHESLQKALRRFAEHSYDGTFRGTHETTPSIEQEEIMSETPRDSQREQSEQPEDEANNEDKAGKDEVQEQSEESFPASDPPSF